MFHHNIPSGSVSILERLDLVALDVVGIDVKVGDPIQSHQSLNRYGSGGVLNSRRGRDSNTARQEVRVKRV